MLKLLEHPGIVMSDMRFFQRMCAEQIELPELKKFVAGKQRDKIQYKIGQELDRLLKKPIIFTNRVDTRELGRLGAINEVMLNMDWHNLDVFIGVVDACNITLNGEDNCDIIVGKATEDELKSYVYNLMKQFEEKYDSVESDFQKRK